uniref:Protein ABHD1 isoform X2 n=1 Tax=Pogona vitticeps TaxID=103695 RepID=A0ABM5F8B7_9SAUR
MRLPSPAGSGASADTCRRPLRCPGRTEGGRMMGLSLLLLLLGFSTGLLAYYWARVPKRPLLVACEPFRSFLEKYCPIVSETFYPTPWCFEGRLQTIVQAFLKSCPPVSYHSEVLRTPDGGQLLLDWAEEERGGPHHPAPEACPIVLFLPGLTGNSQEAYILHMVQSTRHQGYRAVVFNNRGCKGEELLTPQTFCADSTEDLELVVGHIRREFPRAPLMAVGVSLGGILVLNYLSQKGPEAGLAAAMACSVSWDSSEAISSLESPLNRVLFNQRLTANLRQLVRRHKKVLAEKLDVEHVLKASGGGTLRRACSDAPWPGFLLTAIPLEAAKRVPGLALLVTARGGHIGFLEGLLPRHQSYMDRVFAQFAGAAFEHRDELAAAVAAGGAQRDSEQDSGSKNPSS